MKRMFKLNIYILIISISLFGALCVIVYSTFSNKHSKNPDKNNSSTSFNIENLEQRPSFYETMRIKENLTPPTNKWFSGLVFGDSQIAFAYPLSYKATSSGFELSVPRLNSSSNTVAAPHHPEITVDMQAKSYVIDSYDDLSVKSLFQLNNSSSAVVTLTQGVPIVFIQCERSMQANINVINMTDIEQLDETTLLFTTNNQRYGVTAGKINILDNNQIQIFADKKNTMAVFAIPNNATDVESYVESAKNPINTTATNYNVLNDKIETKYSFTTSNRENTIFGKFNSTSNIDASLGSFDTLYGKLQFSSGQSFTHIQDVEKPALKLDLSSIDNNQKQNLKNYLAEDTRDLLLEKTDTYFAGKELYRAANLLMIAAELDEKEISQKLQQKIEQTISIWLSPVNERKNRYFYYDKTIKGITGIESAFGSEEFNDHHFHYGYFIYAASVIAQYDNNFISEHGQMIENLISDIASEQQTNEIPRLRVFDTYTGHSWASGFSNFADGNNQESSSEAVNAWYATYRWANITNNKNLTDFSLWLYVSEINAAKNFWLRDNRNLIGFENYTHPIVSMVWNGKRDYATFFSPRPQAQLGIQLLPMSPGQMYLKNSDIDKNLIHTVPTNNDYTGQFGDYLAMYRSLNNYGDALLILDTLNENSIDDANSKTYLYAWVYSQKSLQ